MSLTDITARKKAEAYVEFLGKHDVLTKLYNRAFYEDELARLGRKGPWPVSVIALDLNGLKQVNDLNGHGDGDALLRRTGEVLKKAVGEQACIARVGGDEFMVLLPGADERSAHLIIEQITQVPELNNQFYGAALSLSLGTATCAQGERLSDTVKAADAQMYAAKRAYYEACGRPIAGAIEGAALSRASTAAQQGPLFAPFAVGEAAGTRRPAAELTIWRVPPRCAQLAEAGFGMPIAAGLPAGRRPPPGHRRSRCRWRRRCRPDRSRAGEPAPYRRRRPLLGQRQGSGRNA